MPFCPYCGAEVKKKDKYCLLCGKPLLTDLSKSNKDSLGSKSAPVKDPDWIKRDSPEEQEVEPAPEMEEPPIEVKEEEEEEEPPVQEEEKKEEGGDLETLPEDVKEQISLHLKLIDIEAQKRTLAEKLKDFQKLLNSDRYETDFEFGEKIELQLEAVKTLIREVKNKELDIKDQLDGEFIVDKLKKSIAIKKDQLKNLTRERKLRRIKDKDVYQKLKKKYKRELKDLEAEYHDLRMGIKTWISELEMERVELDTKRKTNKARYSSKEISEGEFKSKDEEFEKKLTEVVSKIEKLEDLS